MKRVRDRKIEIQRERDIERQREDEDERRFTYSPMQGTSRLLYFPKYQWFGDSIPNEKSHCVLALRLKERVSELIQRERERDKMKMNMKILSHAAFESYLIFFLKFPWFGIQFRMRSEALSFKLRASTQTP